MVDAKECDKGYNCGAACIEKGDKCRKSISQISAERLDGLVGSIIGEDDVAALIDGGNLNRLSNKVRQARQSTFDSHEDAAKYLQYHKDMEPYEAGLKSLDAEPWTNPQLKYFANGAYASEEAYIKREAESRALARRVIDNKSAKNLADIGKKGSPCARNEADRPSFCNDPKSKESKAAIDKRTEDVLTKYIFHDFKDPVTNKPISWRDLQPDHVQPLSKVGSGDKADSYNNLNLVHSAYNQNKLANPYETTLRKVQAQSTPEGHAAKEAEVAASMNKKAAAYVDFNDNYDNVPDRAALIDQYDPKISLRVVANRVNSSIPIDKQPRPFTTSGGRSDWGKKGALKYLAKKLAGVEPTEAEASDFNASLAKSNTHRSTPQTEADIFAKYGKLGG